MENDLKEDCASCPLCPGIRDLLKRACPLCDDLGEFPPEETDARLRKARLDVLALLKDLNARVRGPDRVRLRNALLDRLDALYRRDDALFKAVEGLIGDMGPEEDPPF